VSILSYGGGVQFGVITDATLCPDPQKIIDGFAPEGRRVYFDRTPPRTWPVASYVVTTSDDQFSTAQQETYAAELGATTVRLATGHLPMLERPAELAALLAQAS